MDGPPALTLGLENGRKSVMNEKPVKRVNNIVTKKDKRGNHIGTRMLEEIIKIVKK